MSHKPGEYDAVIEAVFVPNPKLPCKELYNLGRTQVYRVDGPEPLVVRVVSEAQVSSALQLEILEAIDDDVTARILHCETRPIGGESTTIQVQTYLPGAPLDRYPSADEARAIAVATHTLHRRLMAVSDGFHSKGIPSLGDISMGLIAGVAESPMKEAARQLFENSRYQDLIVKETQVLIYGDPWPRNFLFDFAPGDFKVRIVDVDPVIFGPKILQPAMLFSAYFVVSFLQHASDNTPVLSLDELIGHWPEAIDRQDVLLMMQVYPILLSLQKMMQFDPASSDGDLAAQQSNLDLLKRCLEVVGELVV